MLLTPSLQLSEITSQINCLFHCPTSTSAFIKTQTDTQAYRQKGAFLNRCSNLMKCPFLMLPTLLCPPLQVLFKLWCVTCCFLIIPLCSLTQLWSTEFTHAACCFLSQFCSPLGPSTRKPLLDSEWDPCSPISNPHFFPSHV